MTTLLISQFMPPPASHHHRAPSLLSTVSTLTRHKFDIQLIPGATVHTSLLLWNFVLRPLLWSMRPDRSFLAAPSSLRITSLQHASPLRLGSCTPLSAYTCPSLWRQLGYICMVRVLPYLLFTYWLCPCLVATYFFSLSLRPSYHSLAYHGSLRPSIFPRSGYPRGLTSQPSSPYTMYPLSCTAVCLH